MPCITAKELASTCGIEPKNVHTYVGRGKLIKRKDGLFDTSNEINAAFIDKFVTGDKINHSVSKEEIDSFEEKQPEKSKRQNKQSDNSDEDQPSTFVNALQLNNLRAEKLQEEIKQLSLKNQKLEGELIEVEIIQKAVLEVVRNYRKTLYIHAESIIKQNMIDLEANNDQLTKAISDLSALFNAGCTEAIENVKQTITQLI